MKRLDNRGVTLAESLVAFMIICVGVVMLMGCIVSVANSISSARMKNEDSQNKVNQFWKQEVPNETKVQQIGIIYPQNIHGGDIKVQVNTYNVNDENYYEYALVEETEGE